MNFKVTVLGSGTSTGIPIVGCHCKVCTSKNSKDKRLRASLLIETHEQKILIDSGPDLRYQMLRNQIDNIDAVLYTHFHYDHLGGLDDLRPFSQRRANGLDCWCNEQTYDEILSKYPYLKKVSGNHNLPVIHLKRYEGSLAHGYNIHSFGSLQIKPIRLIHVPPDIVYSVGFVVNERFGYLTDFRIIHDDDLEFLQNLEVLFIGAPLARQHPTHCTHSEALDYFERFKVGTGVVGHLAHSLSHDELTEKWSGRAVPAYDGQVFSFAD